MVNWCPLVVILRGFDHWEKDTTCINKLTEDLTENPLFCKLLATLSQHVDRPSLTVTLKRELEKAERDLQTEA